MNKLLEVEDVLLTALAVAPAERAELAGEFELLTSLLDRLDSKAKLALNKLG